MRKITSMSFAFRTLLIAAAPLKAHSQQANTILMQNCTIEREIPTPQMSNDAYGGFNILPLTY